MGFPSMRSLLRVGVELISVVALTRWHLGGGFWPIGQSYAATPCRRGGYEAAAALYHVGPYQRFTLKFKKPCNGFSQGWSFPRRAATPNRSIALERPVRAH